MSKSYCRFCTLTFQGIYINCPKCGKWLPPFPGEDLPPNNDEYEIVENASWIKSTEDLSTDHKQN